MTNTPKNIDEAWGLFNSRRFTYGHDETIYHSFSTALAGVFADIPPVEIHAGSMPCESFATPPSPADRGIDPLTKEVRSVILGFLMCPEIADCDQVDLDSETLALEKRARLLVVDEQHPDDVAVDCFASAMKDKLARKRAEGYGGWHDPSQCRVEFLSRKLREHIAKGDPVDVGNFAMMLHQRGSDITKPDGWSEQALSDDQVEAIVQLVERRLCIIWSQIGAREQFANELRTLEPPADEDAEICEACGEAFEDGDLVYWSADDTGHLHSDCCSPDRDSYVNPDGSPIADGDPIPQPFEWKAER